MDKRAKPLRPRRRSYLATGVRRATAGLARGLVARKVTYSAGHHITPHFHPHAQFLFAVAGTMAVRTPRRAWLVPPSRALWIPADTVHELTMSGTVEMRSVYVDAASSAGMPATCVVLEVTPLARELILRAAALPADYDVRSEDGLLMRLLLAEIRRLPACALDLPLPESPDLTRLCEQVMANFSTRRPCGHDAADFAMSTRTLYRRFLRETGITFARWKQQARLLEAIRRLGAGASVTAVALDLGYESTSAFSTMFRRTTGMVPRAFLPRGDQHTATRSAK